MYIHVVSAWVKTFPRDRAEQGRFEARVLRQVAHPGVVQLLDVTEDGDGGVRLHLARLPGPDLQSLAPADPRRAASLVAGVAAVVADLHGVGVAHGSLDAEHVLLDRNQAPVLCGFGHAVVDAGGQARRSDVDGLARLVGVLLGEHAGSASGRRVRRAVRHCRSAEGVARRLARVSAQPPERRLHRPVVGLAGALALCALVAWLAFGRSSSQAVSGPASSCPATDAGCGPIPAPGGVIDIAAGRFQAGAPGDVIVLGRWDCGGAGLPAVLRPSTGQVWVFDRWPAGDRGVPARPVGRVAGARSLRVIPRRCDWIQVVRAGGRAPVIVTPLGDESLGGRSFGGRSLGGRS